MIGTKRFPAKNPNHSGSLILWNLLYSNPATTPAIIPPSMAIFIFGVNAAAFETFVIVSANLVGSTEPTKS